MSGEKRTSKRGKTEDRAKSRRSPEWATGLKQLYDSVLDEPMPDTFKDLLAQFDSENK